MKNLFLLFAFCLVLEGTFATSKDYVNITQVKDSFVATYVHTTPLKDYVIGVSVSTLEVQKAFHNVTLSYNEAWTDLCLDIMVGAPLPDIVAELLPKTFLDLRVFYRVVPKEEESPIMCPALAMICPDGTSIGMTVVDGKCSMVCPNASQPLGGLSWDQMVEIQKSFENEYLTFTPYSDYIYGIGISTIDIMNATHNITLGSNEHSTDYCLSGLLKRQPRADVEFPSVYKGARVFYSMGGDICILADGSTIGCDGNATGGAFSGVAIILACIFFSALVIVGCRIRRRRCQQAKANLLKAQEQPVATNMAPSDFALDMYPGQYGLQYDTPIDPQYEYQDQQGPIMMVPSGYPVFVPQHGWFLPIPPQQEQQE